ncbi:unnamed protein product [Closterium sp. NIES-53]
MSVTLHTNLGDIKCELFCDEVPKACENFLALCASGYYDTTIFHRNIRGFMIQGGDPTGTGRGGQSIWGGKFNDEIRESLKHNVRGILSMANSGPNTNGSQFFISYAKQPHLNGLYTIFGKVIHGFDVLDLMEKTKTGPGDKPLAEIRINRSRPPAKLFPSVHIIPYRDAMAWQRRHRGLDAIVTVACFLATISLCSGGIPYNVTLASVTLFHKYSWFTAPAVYLSCGDGSGGNRTELPGVNATMRWFNFTGNESWQPVAKLHREECTTCGLYEHEWLGDAIYDTWTVCAANFSSRDERGIFTHVIPSRFHVNLACYECNHAQFQRSSAYGANTTEGGAGSMSVFLWMGLAVAGAGLMILLIAAIVYLVTEADELLDESEKTRFIEMAEEGHQDGHGEDRGAGGHEGRGEGYEGSGGQEGRNGRSDRYSDESGPLKV